VQPHVGAARLDPELLTRVDATPGGRDRAQEARERARAVEDARPLVQAGDRRVAAEPQPERRIADRAKRLLEDRAAERVGEQRARRVQERARTAGGRADRHLARFEVVQDGAHRPGSNQRNGLQSIPSRRRTAILPAGRRGGTCSGSPIVGVGYVAK